MATTMHPLGRASSITTSTEDLERSLFCTEMGTGSKATVDSGTAKSYPSILESLIVIKENRRKIEILK